MAFPLAPAATIGGGMLLNYLFPEEFGGRTQYQGVDPRQFKDQLTIDDGEIAGIRGDITRRATAANAGNRAAIKQRGAAGRLPRGDRVGVINPAWKPASYAHEIFNLG